MGITGSQGKEYEGTFSFYDELGWKLLRNCHDIIHLGEIAWLLLGLRTGVYMTGSNAGRSQ